MSLPIGVINLSTVVSNDDVAKVAVAVQKQIFDHASIIWPIRNVRMEMADKNWKGWTIAVLDNSDQADALGYHELTKLGMPVSFVFAKTCIDDKVSWSVCFSHESLEMMVDPYINATADVGDAKFYAYEVCDPVEDDSFGYEIDGVLVSDFVTPEWFIEGAAGPYSFKQHVSAPLTLAKGGYCSYFDPKSGKWSQQTDFSKVSARAVPTR